MVNSISKKTRAVGSINNIVGRQRNRGSYRYGNVPVHPGTGQSYIEMADNMFDFESFGINDEGDNSGDFNLSNYMYGDYYELESDEVAAKQLSLPLETNEELRDRLAKTISIFNYRYAKLAEYAVRWKMLQDVIEDDEDFKKNFNSLMMQIKLSGYKI